MDQKILTFEQFTDRKNEFPRYNNFALLFRKGTAFFKVWREQEYFQGFQRETPELEERLTTGISALEGLTSEALVPYDHDLYGAYRIMRKHGASDATLIGLC